MRTTFLEFRHNKKLFIVKQIGDISVKRVQTITGSHNIEHPVNLRNRVIQQVFDFINPVLMIFRMNRTSVHHNGNTDDGTIILRLSHTNQEKREKWENVYGQQVEKSQPAQE